MYLVIVESPTKARTIGRFLGNDYQIIASMGHVVDLSKKKLGVDVDNDFSPDYQVIEDKKKTIKELKEKASRANTIILATDPDREGEAIASHVVELLKDTTGVTGKKARGGFRFQRIVFHEITKEAIQEALQHPRDIDMCLVSAQTARRVLDRLVGYKLSPLLWQKVRRGLSAGRVQSVAVRLIVEREREREKFLQKPYWTIHVWLKSERQDATVEFELVEIDGEKIEEKETITLYDGDYTFSKTTIDIQKKADAILKDLEKSGFIVLDILQKKTKRSPYPAFTTSTLAQEASRRFGFSAKRTMRAAQKLYEEGHITYHRTDSVAMSKSAIFAMRAFIKKEFDKKYVSAYARVYKTKQKLAQEAHEAIRPTNISNQQLATLRLRSGQASNQLGGDAIRLYELIWKRAVATQMADAILESTTVLVDAGGPVPAGPATRSSHGAPASLAEAANADALRVRPTLVSPAQTTYRFKASGSVVVFDGFLKLYPQALSEQRLPVYAKAELLTLTKKEAMFHQTAPPPRYNEASLIATLEEKGIGRPSTYAPIISTIQDRQYTEKDESGRFVPTPVGNAVNDFLVKNFSDIDDIPFTAQMEDELDAIAGGKSEWVPMIKTFYDPFAQKLEQVKTVGRVTIETEKTDEICKKCGSPMVIRTGKFGKFLSCSTFPTCDFSKSFIQKTQYKCPKDGGMVIVKRTKKGRQFYGCSNYPTCDFAAWNLKNFTKPLQEEPKEIAPQPG